MMSESELETLVIEELQKAGVLDAVDRDASQFLSVSSGFFAEVVLTDASRQADAEHVLKRVMADLQRSGIALETIVRSLWEVVDVYYRNNNRALDEETGIALAFRARLKSGSREVDIRVDVSIAALTILRQELGKNRFITHPRWSPEKGDVAEANIRNAVKMYLETLLEQGGRSYWDPLLVKHIDMSASGMSYVLGHTVAFQELHDAITDAFSPGVRKSFFEGLRISHVNLAEFDKVLPELSQMLGGVHKIGERFSVNAAELFNNLPRSEQELLRAYLYAQAQRTQIEDPRIVTGISQRVSGNVSVR